MVSPGNTSTESPARISSVGTSTHNASEQSTLSAERSLSEEVMTSRDSVDINDCKLPASVSLRVLGFTGIQDGQKSPKAS